MGIRIEKVDLPGIGFRHDLADFLDAGAFEAADDLLRPQAGRQVDIVDRQVQEIVANRAADIARQPVGSAQGVEHRGHAAA